MNQSENPLLGNNCVTYNKQPLKVQRKEQSLHGSHIWVSNQLILHPREYYNMFGERIGGIDPKEINGANLTM